ncbi:ranBP-type and C3HC4-type zinc finger-containing protein 1-like [Watersipora subatra]|uniref:ranBP-type and C3HC4-type zinc finger-containing protein 1-like n=1 Tax=Watersipora subatra TaxID=2589382 RepID=UPI00355C7364
MEESCDLMVYGLSTDKGSKYKIQLLGVSSKSTVKDLKLRILRERNIPVECQTLFHCKDQKLHLPKNEEKISSISNCTLHLYVTKSAQQKTLEKTRQSDFDNWLTKIKQLHLTGEYQEELPGHVKAAHVPVSHAAKEPKRIHPQITAEIPKRTEVLPQAPARGATLAKRPAGQVMKTYNSVADNCQLCNRKGTLKPSTHYCLTCDEYSCVLCSVCAGMHPQDHVIEQIQYKNAVTPKTAASVDYDADAAAALHHSINELELGSWICDICTVVNTKDTTVCVVCDTKNPNTESAPEPVASVGWQCGTCTLVNLPYRPSCSMCAEDRPADYQIPERYVPADEERQFVDGGLASQMALEQALEEEKRQEAEERERNRKLLIGADESNLIANDEDFECQICYTECQAGEGVKLRDCLHTFCKDCLKGHVESSENPEVYCPYMDDNYQCNEAMQEREIREIAPEFLPKLLEKSLQVAESQAADSFHCKTLNCPGWCTYDEDVNFFKCPVCQARNCLTCQAIHDNQNCKEYQDDLKRKAEIDDEAKKTQEELERLLREHLAMHCPKCKIIIMKKTGCDWIQCSVCKTEICWVTRQARWGPKGRGDTSAGCKCNVNGHPCAPNCGNCH